MDHILENKFLNKEGAYKSAYNEQETAFKAVGDSDEVGGTEAQEFQIYESFVKEKGALLGYIHDIVHYVALKQGFDSAQFFEDKAVKVGSKINSEQDLFNIKNRIIIILEKYQEQSAVLDSILERVITPIMSLLQAYVRKQVGQAQYLVSKDVSNLFEIILWLCKVRGYKTVVKFFPHEVADMEPVVEILHFQHTEEWWISYVLILWLSIIVLVPFDIETIDSKKEVEILIKRMINIGLQHMGNSSKIREAITVLLSKLLTRPDVIKSGETDQVLNKLAGDYQEFRDNANHMFMVSGILQTLVEIFKTGHREDLLPRVDTVFDPILKTEVKNKFMNKSTILRKQKVKLAQRIGQIFLKPKVTKWRYERGFRSLQQNLQKQQESQQQKQDNQEEEDMEDEDLDFEKLEFIIQYLLEGLKDEDNVVRWTAAKGLGRITGRLNKEFADQIVEQLYELFDDNETDSAWHGGCLALAELCRRGLLLPERLAQYVPILEKALIYDINRGNFSVGAHVRDAACYVVWSFARAYSPEIMKPHVQALSTALIVESLFDREVNCRRAASATFQECVGRQGNFPHGIEILTEADYFTLSNRVNAYLNVSCFVAQFPEYFESMVKHLAFIKLRHQEPSLRVLASQALSVLCPFNPELIVTQILTPLIELCTDKALHIRHGAILGVGEILIGLSGNSHMIRKEVLDRAHKTLSLKERQIIEDSENHKQFRNFYEGVSSQNYLSKVLPSGATLRDRVKHINDQVEKLRLYRGKGGEIMRAGVCHLIYSMSISQIDFNQKELMELFKTLQENFKHPNIEIQEEAVRAFKAYTNAYYKDFPIAEKAIVTEIKHLFKGSKISENIAITRGYNMAFGELSYGLIKEFETEVLDVLMTNCQFTGKEADDAETRRAAVKSLTDIVKTVGLRNIQKDQQIQILETFYNSVNDYQVDRRGDVGSWVREQAMTALKTYVRLVLESGDQQIISNLKADQPQFCERFVSTLLQQLMEKIDKVREIAGKSLQEFFKYVAQVVPEFAEKDRLTALFVQREHEDTPYEAASLDEGVGYLPWRSAEFVFQSISPFFDSDAYSLSILKGLITSSGGLTESTLKASSHSLFQYLSTMSKDKQQGLQNKKLFLRKIITIFQQSLKEERVTIPLMKTIEMLLSSDYLGEEGLSEEMLQIHSLTVQECSKSKNIAKLISSTGVFSGMLALNNQVCQQKAVKSMLFLLYHSFPKVRKITAEKLYTGLLTMEDATMVIPNGEEDYDKVIEMLSETNWTDQLKDLNPTKPTLYGFFGMEPPPKATSANSKESNSNATTGDHKKEYCVEQIRT